MFDNELSKVDLTSVRGSTSFEDNTVSERRLTMGAIKRTARSPEELKMYMDMLGIRPEWLREEEAHQTHERRRAVPRGPFQ